MRKQADFSGGLKPIFRPHWRISAEVFLLILFATVRQPSVLKAHHLVGQHNLARGGTVGAHHEAVAGIG